MPALLISRFDNEVQQGVDGCWLEWQLVVLFYVGSLILPTKSMPNMQLVVDQPFGGGVARLAKYAREAVQHADDLGFGTTNGFC